MSLATVENWEARLRAAFDRADAFLEQKYAGRFTLKPNRPPHEAGSTRDADGVFDLTVGFTAGFGSKYGEGYVFRVRLATFDHVPPATRTNIETEAIETLTKEIAAEFPGRDLRIVVDGEQYKVIGDLSLK